MLCSLFSRAPHAAWFLAVIVAECASAADEPAVPLSPLEARAKVGQKITVEMTVQAAKNRLEKRGEIYLDSEPDFHDEKNFAVVINRAGAALFRQAGVEDPAEHFATKTIRVSGVVKVVEGVPRIEVDDPQQMEIVKPK